MHVLYELLFGSEINGFWGKNAIKMNKISPEIHGDGGKNAPLQLKLILILTILEIMYIYIFLNY